MDLREIGWGVCVWIGFDWLKWLGVWIGFDWLKIGTGG
jgi:hypothetical protein